MTSREYWLKREAEQRKRNITDEKEYQKEIKRIYEDMMDSIQKEIDSFYARYADKEGITLAEAKRRVSQLDIDAYARKAERYVRDKDFSEQANEEMRLYNLTMKINRLEMLKANIGLELVSGFDELQKYFEQTLTDRTLSEFERQAGILGEFPENSAIKAHAIVNASFYNATFSERIWMHQDVLKSELSKLLQTGLIQGKGSRELARILRQKIDASRSDAECLMTTELRRVQTGAAKQSYERNGNDEYEFMAGNPKGACPICQALDGKHFPVKDLMPGKNAPPMHPRCHCATAPYWDEEEFQRWLEEENRKLHERMQDVEQNPPAELQRRRIGSQGQEIIDKPTYNKLTKDFLRHGGIIIRGKDAEKHLNAQGAYASYVAGGNFAFIRDDATVSDVLEEMYHAEQDRKNLFSEYPDNEVLLRREIDAQHYLISVAKKYKIPLEETEVTRKNLAEYEDKLSQIVNRETGEE